MDKDETMNNKTYLISLDSLKTILQGALGAMTFGAYHQFTTNRMMDMMEKNHENALRNMERNHTNDMNEMEKNHENDMNEMKIKISNLEKKTYWFFS